MRASIRKSIRKWAISAGCVLSVALLLQHVKANQALQAAPGGDPESQSVIQQDPSPQDPVFQEWLDQRSQETPAESDDSGESAGETQRHGHRLEGSGNSGFQTRSGHS